MNSFPRVAKLVTVTGYNYGRPFIALVTMCPPRHALGGYRANVSRTAANPSRAGRESSNGGLARNYQRRAAGIYAESYNKPDLA